ncbi:MAG: PEGA domain-containing protein, partial [Verrucomicrobia bacterium]
PAAAITKINGTQVGQTPFRVDLARKDVFRVDFEKNGFAPQSALLLPSSTEYEARFLRWGIDYDLGAVNDLVPAELFIELKPALGGIAMADRFSEMSAQVLRADALLASGELTRDDHAYLIQQIVATYRPRF